MNYILDKTKQEIVKAINQILGSKLVEASDLVYPPDSEMGDLSLPVFKISKILKLNPQEITNKLIKGVKLEIIAGTKAQGAYFNIFINKAGLAEELFNNISQAKSEYGKNKQGGSKRVMVEYTNVNTHKEYHVGHLRNLCYGDAVSRILKANGFHAIPVSYINDFGIHVAKTLWAYLSFTKEAEPKDGKGKFLGETYVRASQEAEQDKTAKQKIEFIMKKIESREGKEYELWQKTREWSIRQFEEIYREMGVKLNHVFYESELIDQGKEMVKKLVKQGILVNSQGAIIADLNEYKLGVLVVIRSDGTAAYPVADLPLAKTKIEKYKLDKSIYVVDNRQSLYFKQLFKILELMGFKQDLIHLPFDFVKLPEGMMASRTGNVITYDQLKAAALNKSILEIKARHQDWPDKKVQEVANKIIVGAIKFEMLKVSANQIITFDIEKALSFQGYTAAYLQYTYARINSIIKKADAKINLKKFDPQSLKEKLEQTLIIKLAKYPEIVRQAGASYESSNIAKYLFELAQEFNDYYHKVPILKSDKKIQPARLILIQAISQVIKNGLDLLGIEIIKEM